jgi:hypothetical protein
MKIPLDSDLVDNENSRLKDAWGQLIHGWSSWTWYTTLTFQRYVYPEDAKKHFWTWARTLAKGELEAHFWAAWVVERAGNNSHIHALLWFPEHSVLTGRQVAASWKTLNGDTGMVDIKAFDPRKGAAWDISKSLEPEIDLICPRFRSCRRRGTGCIFKKSPR